MKKANPDLIAEYIEASETTPGEDLDMAFALLFEEVEKRRENQAPIPDERGRLLPSDDAIRQVAPIEQ